MLTHSDHERLMCSPFRTPCPEYNHCWLILWMLKLLQGRVCLPENTHPPTPMCTLFHRKIQLWTNKITRILPCETRKRLYVFQHPWNFVFWSFHYYFFFQNYTGGRERGKSEFFHFVGIGSCLFPPSPLCLSTASSSTPDANGRKSAAICLALICHLCNVLCDFFKQNSKQQILRYNRINGM